MHTSKTSENRKDVLFKKFFEYSLDMLCVAGTDGYFKIINSSFSNILGWSEKELLSEPFIHFVHADDIENTINETKKLAKGVPTISFKNRYKRKSGDYVWMNWTCFPDKETGDLYAIAHDITELVKINEKLESTIAFKDIFLANMSHEIRTPMNAIIGFTDLLNQTQLNDEQRDYVSTILTASQNLLVIINDILDYSKIESGKISLEFRPISIKNLVDNVIKLVSTKSKSKGIKLLTSLDNDIPYAVIGDSVRLTQVLVNLLNNAIKFTDEGKVELQVISDKQEDSKVNISFIVRDTGIGIAKDKLDIIFERFEQASNSTTRQFGGTGLGLSIVKMLVKMHNGTINVKSKLNEGTEFKVDFLFEITDEPLDPKPVAKIQSKAYNLEGINILVAEDNLVNQKLITKYLTKHGADLTLTNNGLECIEKLKMSKYDVILMDLQMPLLDGKSATIEIRKSINKSIPIIACTADSIVGEKSKCIELGMNSYISKPYSEEKLIHEIITLVDSEKINSNNNKEDVELKLNELEKKEGKEFLLDLIEVFIITVSTDIENLEFFLKSKDTKSIAQISHKIAGSLLILNFKKMSKISKELENAAKNRKIKQVNEIGSTFVFEIKSILDKIKSFIEK